MSRTGTSFSRSPRGTFKSERPMEERFWSKVDRTAGDEGCWLWTAATSRNGYGRFAPARSTDVGAHRVAYELLIGPIPEGLQLDHLCRVRHCVNPAHLEPVTPRENFLRGFGATARNARKTHCPQGHPYDETNTIVTGRGFRICRTCENERARRKRADARVLAPTLVEQFRSDGVTPSPSEPVSHAGTAHHIRT